MISHRKIYILSLLIIFFSLGFLFPKTYSLFQLSKEVEGSVVVPENNYCINNGFNKFSECALLMENYAETSGEAKDYILSKKVESYSNVAPVTTYKEKKENISDPNGIIIGEYTYSLASSYSFNSSTGMFNLKGYTNSNSLDGYLDYYTCGNKTGGWTNCATMYQIKAYKKMDDGSYNVTEAVIHNPSAVDALDSEIGLYATTDDLGTSYYYRGNVKNNYVSFAGYIWRIIRINGNGTIRMIYSGKSTSDTGDDASIGISTYNTKDYDPTHIGYKYGENFVLNTTATENIDFTRFNQNTSYYFASSYEPIEVTEDGKRVTKFRLKGNTVSGLFKNIHNPVNTAYPYTCFSTSPTDTCNYIVKINKYVNASKANVSFISYSSVDYESMLGNDTNSTVKSKVDAWYEKNILNKYDKYLSDEIFCNDRSIASGPGYGLIPETLTQPEIRMTSKNPSLKCNQAADKFTVSSAKGNGALTYPVGLITIDEVALAGGVYNTVNTQYYLYTGSSYWTLSTQGFSSSRIVAKTYIVFYSGSIVNNWVSYEYGIRPVINLKADVLISGGDGTAINPYVIYTD